MQNHAAAPLQRYAGQPSELQRLRDRVEELETLLGLNVDLTGIRSKMVRSVVGLLLKRQIVSGEMIEIALSGGKMVSNTYPRVALYYARRYLRKRDIDLRNHWGVGWYISPADKKKLQALIDREALIDGPAGESEAG